MIKHRTIKSVIFIGALCLAGFSLSNFSVNASSDGVEARIFKSIEIAAQKGKLKDSRGDIQRVLKLNPRHAGATFFAGIYSFDEGNFANAEKFFKRIENDSSYGARARAYLADIRAEKFRKKFHETLEIYMTGESFGPALALCEEAIRQNQGGPDVIFTATYCAVMQGMQSRSENYAQRFAQESKDKLIAADLTSFVNGWFLTKDYPEAALENLLSISDRRLLTQQVRNRIKDLIVSLKQIDQFEMFIAREKKVAGADTGSLERELIGFLIEQRQYEKALDLINRRPVDSIEDNLLYIKLLSFTSQEKKAMSTARQLLSSSPQELRLFQAWTEAWLKHVERTQNPPDGFDEGGKNFTEMADEILARIKPDKLINLNPELLINLLRMSFMTSNETQFNKIKLEVRKIAFNDRLADMIVKTVDELVIFNLTFAAVDLLENVSNQLPENHNLQIKLAEIHLVDNPQLSVKILETLLNDRPEMLRAFLLWVDSMNLTGQGNLAEREIIRRLEDTGMSDVVKRQLTAKLEVLRMQNIQDNSNLFPVEEDSDTEAN